MNNFCHRLFIAICLAGVLAAMVPASAQAQSSNGVKKVAIVSIAMTGEGSQVIADSVERNLTAALNQEQVEVVPLATTRNAAAKQPNLLDCTTPDCLQTLSGLLGAKQFVETKLEVSGNSYAVEMSLYTTSSANQLRHRVKEECTACTVAEFEAMLSKACGQIAGQVSTTAQSVTIHTKPTGGTITIDSSIACKSPCTVDLNIGPHEVVASKTNYTDTKQSITVNKRGEAQRFDILLIRDPVLAAKEARGSGPWKWVAGAGAVAALGTGITLLAIDGNGLSCNQGLQCEERYNTGPQGWALVGAGVGLGALTTWLFVKDSKGKNSQNTKLSILPHQRGGYVGVFRSF